MVTAEDQGWVVDDGTCDACFRGEHHRCTKPDTSSLPPDELWEEPVSVALCCCDEGYEL